jgi:hypothetical protein
MGFLQVIKKAKEFWSWYSFAAGVSALAITGAGFAVGGAVWLVHAGLPIPLALMAGYCTLVGAVYFAMAPLAYRALVAVQVKAPPKVAKNILAPINLTPIRLQHQYELGAASRLWVGLSPNSSNSTQESSAWYETFVSAIQQNKLDISARHIERRLIEAEKSNPDWTTIVSRKEFQRYAASIGQDPPFLRDA